MYLNEAFMSDLVKVSIGLKPALSIACGEKVSDKGKVSLVYARFNLHPDCKEHTVDGMLAYLEAGNKNKEGMDTMVTVAIPKATGVTLRVELSPIMSGKDAAMLIRYHGRHPKVEPTVEPKVEVGTNGVLQAA